MCFGASLLLTTVVIISLIVGPKMIIQTGVPLYFLGVVSVIAGMWFGVRGWQLGEEKFRWQFGLVFNAIMLFALIMIAAIVIFVRAEGMG